MKPKLFTLLLVTFSTSVYTQTTIHEGYFVIKGKFGNIKDSFVECSLTGFLKSERLPIPIGADGSFEERFPVHQRQNFSLTINETHIRFGVRNHDTIFVDWKNVNDNSGPVLTANTPLRTSELTLQKGQSLKTYKPFSEVLRTPGLDASEVFNRLNKLYQNAATLIRDSAGFNSPELELICADFYFDFSYFLMNLRIKHNLPATFESNMIFDKYQPSPYDSGGFIKYNKDWFLDVPYYRELFASHVQWGRSGLSSKRGPVIEREYDNGISEIADIFARDWYTTRMLMNKYRYMKFDQVQMVYDRALQNMRSSYWKEKLVDYYNFAARLRPGSPSPPFTLKDANGKMVSLKDFAGKVVYLDFWGVHCGPCIEQIRNHYPKLHEKYKNSDVVFLNVCVDVKEGQWRESINKLGMKGINLIAEGWNANPVNRNYNVTTIPRYYLIDKLGNIADASAKRPEQILRTTGLNDIDVLLQK